jgi:predicted house-cleaning noncanonical NTP pyrophosphatase (MazG superfamily)
MNHFESIMQTRFIANLQLFRTIDGANQMSKEKKELEDAVMEEFEWALKDPNTEKIRQLGEVVSIITTKLTEAISNLQATTAQLQSQVSALDSKIDSISSRVASGASISAGGPSAASAMAGGEPIATMAKAPTAAPPAAGGGMSMMGELKQLLAARRKKSDT